MSAKRMRKSKNNSVSAAALAAPGASLPPACAPDAARGAKPDFVSFADKALSWGLGLLCLLVSVSFYTGTYDTAFVKITLLQTGGIALAAVWAALLAAQKRWPLTRGNLPWLLPFLVYYGWNFLGYALSPYKAEGFDEFFRYVLYFLLSLMVLDRFTRQSARVLTKCIVLAAWISCLYGFVQVLDRWLPGLDVMPWRGFFGARIFSTHANPNFFADFVVFSSFIVLVEYLRTRQKRLLVLLGAAAADLFFSESKGAWLGFAASAAFFAALYTNCTFAPLKKHLRKINIAAAALLLGAVVLAGVYAGKRFQSVSFRAHTWAATFAMAQDSPVMGTGVGSFKTIYPAYRKPQIFYIEKMHNNETQHAENEYLEQWATAGTVGLAVFLWLIAYVLWAGAMGLKEKAAAAREAGAGLAPEGWWLLGYGAAFFGILVHNFFDVSMRFVSTGLFFAVFSALVVRLCMPAGPQERACCAPARSPVLLWAARVALCAGVAWLVWYFIYTFTQTAGSVGAKGFGGALLKAVAWAVFCGVTLLGAWTYLRAAFLARWARAPFILLLSLLPLQFVYGFFLSDHYYGIAAEFSRRGLFDGALDYYQKAVTHNPLVASYRQYRAYVLRQTADLQRSYSPSKGDGAPLPGQTLLNDYDRALRDLDFVRRRSPNHSLLYQAYGEFYYSYAVLFTKLSQTAELKYQREDYEKKAVENMELAKKSFERSLLTDPVNEATYAYLASIAMMERNPARAQQWIDAYRRGPDGVTEPEFLQKHKHNARMDQMQERLRRAPFNYFPAGAK